MADLNSIFDEVKRNFFPKWDPANEWKVQIKSRLSYGLNIEALCNIKTKIIEINRSFAIKDDNELRCLLAHEICHAIYEGNHTKKWQQRFIKVGNRAKSLGQKKLAEIIYKDIERMKTAIKPTLPAILHEIEDALMVRPDASFITVIEWVADHWGYTGSGLLGKYKSLKKHFYKIRRQVLFYRNHQAG